MGRTWSACTACRWIHKHVISVEEGPCLINIQPTLTAPLHQTITPIHHHNTSSYSSYHFENKNPSSKSTQTPQVQVPNPPRKAKLQKKNAFHKRQQPHHLRVRTPIPSLKFPSTKPLHPPNTSPKWQLPSPHKILTTSSLFPQTLKPFLPPHRTSTLGNGVGGVAKTAGGVVGAAGRGVGQTVTGMTGSVGKPVGDALEAVGNGVEGGARSVGDGVEDAGKGRKGFWVNGFGK